MKLKRRNREKKLILRICILTAMLFLLIILLFLSSEKANKIGIVDNVKKILTGQSIKGEGQLQNDINYETQENESDNIIDTRKASIASERSVAPSDEYMKWNYMLNGDRIMLQSYISNIPEVTVYGSYEINNQTYITDISSLSFMENDIVQSIVFASDISADTVTSMSRMFTNCRSLRNVELEFRTMLIRYMDGMFDGCEHLREVRFGNNFYTGNVISMNNMFANCKFLTYLDLSRINTRSVTSMNNMFGNCESLSYIDFGYGFSTDNVTEMISMFKNCKSLRSLDLSCFNTSNAINMADMFGYCENLTNLNLGNNFDTSNVTNMNHMFYNCLNLASLDLGDKFNTSKVTNMSEMFEYCEKLTSLNLGNNFDTCNVTNMMDIFACCKSLSNLDLGNKFDTTNVTEMNGMFASCSSLTNLDLGDKFNTANATNMRYMFNGCSNLTDLNLGNKFDTGKVSNMYGMFTSCSNLTNLNLGDKFDTNKVTDMTEMFDACNPDLSVTYAARQENSKFSVLTVPAGYNCWYDQFNNERGTGEDITYDTVTLTLKPRCTHVNDYEDNHDGISHKVECTICSEIINSNEPHEWNDNGVCTKCNAKKQNENKTTHTLVIENEMAGHTYNAYQLFSGDFYESEDSQGNKKPTLSNIEWGKEIKKIPTGETEKTYGDKLIEILKNPNENTYASSFENCKTAEDVANVIKGKENDGLEIREFSKVVGQFILENNIQITKSVSQQTTYTQDGVDKLYYQISDLEAGYYIIVDAKANEKDDSYSRYLIDVVQDVTMTPKSSIPTLAKKVKTNNVEKEIIETNEDGTTTAKRVKDETVNTATYQANGMYDINFEIVTTIPTNLDSYGNSYEYKIVDILSKGFEYDRENVSVYIGENKTEYLKDNYELSDVIITESNYESYKQYFNENSVPNEQYGKTLIIINIKDLPGQIERGTILEGQKITIEYNAKLNGKGEVGNVANINEAYLKYSNNPYDETSKAQTKISMTSTYTIDLHLSKIAELKDESSEKIYLEGAEFDIYNKPETNKDRTPITTVATNELGQTLYSSLGTGTYYLKETKAPEGYNKLREEIVIEVKAVCDEYGLITWTVEEKNSSNLILAKIEAKDGTIVPLVPEIKLQVENTSGFQLPITGGKGTIIFTVIGLSLMVTVVAYLNINKKNK